MNTPMTSGARRTVTLERTFEATIEEVWDLWTTKEGIESWWGPDGFAVTVRRLDLRPGGELLYAMTAVGSDQIEFMKNAGMPLVSETRVTYTEVDPPRRLAYSTLADFIPGVRPYDVTTVVELRAIADGVKLVLTQEAMHDEQWTQMAVMGWESELNKLAKVLKKA
ncbi:MAG: SRPBCC domain-containing protein [Chloroflexota bacterium]|nr:SRPBCC domain-containing protein [Chloroflexota bacterium]